MTMLSGASVTQVAQRRRGARETPTGCGLFTSARATTTRPMSKAPATPLRLRQRRNDFSEEFGAGASNYDEADLIVWKAAGEAANAAARDFLQATLELGAVSCCARIRARARATWHAHVRDAVRNSGSACRRPGRRVVSKGSVSDPDGAAGP